MNSHFLITLISLFIFFKQQQLIFVEKQDPSKGVFFSIKVSDGHKLGNLSAFPQEQEVLLEPG